ncbi:LysR family transcriptional regulator [Millisia brevis]|uniref:LysR family transcriptional regulator n=1 Tax=Millisia brevis TaxID=264148 RepID=UPI00082E0141|nr:LysR family transcriptional regulator [Millisia brevis]
MVDLRRMLLLGDLAELGTVAAVANRRGITSSAVSQQLRVLETEVGAVLFRRTGRTLGLTASGKVLVEHSKKVLGALDDALTAVAETRDSTTGTVTITSFNMGIPMLVAPMIELLNRTEPDLTVKVHQSTVLPGGVETALRLLRQGDVDLAVTCSYHFDAEESRPGLVAEELLVESLVLMAPPRLHAMIQARGPAALGDHPWVTGPEDSGLARALMLVAERAGFTPDIGYRVFGAQHLCDVAATQVAAAIVPLGTVAAHHRQFVVPDLTFGTRTLSATIREGRQRDPNIRVVLRALRSVVAERWTDHRPERLSAAS